jgi:single-stranded-DNA-specific exonuclease
MKTFRGFRWKFLFKEVIPPSQLIARYGRLLAQLLANRGFTEPPAESVVALHAQSVPHLEEATEKIVTAVKRGVPIFLFGDYDVDGLTSTALMFKLLRRLGAKRVYPVVPERSEGYGLLPPFVEKFYRFAGEGLIIALDNGTKEVETVKLAQKLGFEVVIFDHHTPGDELPPCPVVNPKISSHSPEFLKDLSTVGLVYLFAKYLERLGIVEANPLWADLAALGTVADVSPLTPLNARLVKRGLFFLNRGESSSLGLEILLQNLRLENLNENDIAFRLAPRLNAFGRMERARRGLKFLITQNREEAEKLFREMEALNTRRRELTERFTREVIRYYEKNPSKALIYVGKIPKGILGIVAGRATSLLGVPSVIFSTDGKTAVGSSRAPEGINIVKILEKISPLMERWGGHSQAAGLSLSHENLPTFKTAFLKEVESCPPSVPTIEVDFPLPPKLLRENSRLREDIQRLQPFGAGNPYPRFVFEDRLLNFKRNRYGFVLYFEKNGRLFMNTTARDKNIPEHLRGKRLRVVYSVDNPKRLELTVEDFGWI